MPVVRSRKTSVQTAFALLITINNNYRFFNRIPKRSRNIIEFLSEKNVKHTFIMKNIKNIRVDDLTDENTV